MYLLVVAGLIKTDYGGIRAKIVPKIARKKTPGKM